MVVMGAEEPVWECRDLSEIMKKRSKGSRGVREGKEK